MSSYIQRFINTTAVSALLKSLQKKTELLRIFLHVSGNLTFARTVKLQYFTSTLLFFTVVSLESISLLFFSSDLIILFAYCFFLGWHVVKIQSVEKWTLTHLFSLLYNSVSQSEEFMYSVMLSKVSWSVNCLLKTLTLKGFSSVCTLWGKNTNDLNPLHRNISIHILLTVLCTITKLLTRRICLTIESFFSSDQFLYSYDNNVWFSGDIVRRN